MIAFIISLLPVLIFLPESLRSGGMVYRLTHVHASVLSVGFILLLLVLRVLQKKPILSRFYQHIYLFLTVFLAFLTALSLGITYATFPNFIYALTSIRVEIVGYMLAAAMFIWLIEKENTFLLRNRQYIALLFPLIFSLICLCMRFLPHNILFALALEDSLIENVQVIALLIGGFASVTLGWKFRSKNQWYTSLFLLMGLLLFCIAGEEISWGQRIFHFDNASLESINVQKETNVHNIRGIHGTIPLIYMIIGFLGSVGAFFIQSASLFSKKIRMYFVPKTDLFFFFFIPFLYNMSALQYGPFTESTELLLYMGISLFILQTQLPTKIKSRKKTSYAFSFTAVDFFPSLFARRRLFRL